MKILPAIVAAAVELDAIDLRNEYLSVPWEEVFPGDIPVRGTVDEDLRRLYAIWMKAQAELEHGQMNLRIRAVTEGKDVQDPSYAVRHRELCFLGNLVNIYMLAFTTEIRIAFPEVTDKPIVLVRKGWQVVYRNAPVVALPAPTVLAEPNKTH